MLNRKVKSMNDRKIGINLNVKNFGPHNNLKFDDETDSIKIGLFANNGKGKTFISRAFRLASLTDYDTSYAREMADNILTTSKNDGKFEFKITDLRSGTNKNLGIKLERGSKPVVNNDSGYFFHVFNSDYVAENLEVNDFDLPDDNIKGFILGKSQIDVKEEKKELDELNRKLKKIKDQINNSIEKAIGELDTLKISKNTKEYKEVTFENITRENIKISEDESFDNLGKDHNRLKSMPDDLEDIQIVHYKVDSSVLNDVKMILTTHYDKSNLPQDFVNQVKLKQTFIEEGIDLYNSNKDTCPFCKQKLNQSAIKIINLYNDYIKDSEAKTIKEIERIIGNLSELKNDIESHYNKFYQIEFQFNDIKKYFPSTKNMELKHLNDYKSIHENIDELIEMLYTKKESINATNFKFKNIINNIEDFLEDLSKDLDGQIDKINDLNKIKKDTKKEKRLLNKRLCSARYLNIINEQETNLQKFKKLTSQISDLEIDIEKKENEAKINRRQEVIKSLEYFLNFFFNGKYEFDQENFCIKFMEESLSNNATHVLSSGEKGIVAFCYYLATVHTIINKKSDYKNLFFVIDDPISSMDFDFVYKITECIGNINQHFDPNSFDRFIILTHNFEFMNLIMSNRIVSQKYILEKENILVWKDNLLLPYESHLSDIIQVTNGERPLHTTPNSIRHVLETICYFEYRSINLLKYVSNNPTLKNSSYIYSLMQDLSHGRFRLESLPENDIIQACTVIKEFITEKYPEQLKKLA